MKSKISNNAGLFIALFVITACGGGGGDDDDGSASGGGSGLPVTTTTYTVNFSADQVVSGAAAPDTVSATANLQTRAGDDFTASGTISITGASASAVTIHVGSAGEAGPPVLALSGSGGSWSIPAGTELDTDERNLLEASAFYVLVETAQGRLRAQILAPGWELSMLSLTAKNAVPASSSTGSGIAGFMLAPDFGDYRIRITTSGMEDAISASLRNAVAGARGDVRVALEAASGRPGVWGTADINNLDFGPRFSSGDFRLLEEGSLYLSVETASSPEGAIRGQLLPEGVGVFPISLSSGEVVSDTSVATSGEASAAMTYSESGEVFALALDTTLADATGVFVHRATAGSNGPLLFSLIPDSGLPGNWVLQPTMLDADLAAALENDELYVSVSTPSYPAGELRGQLTREPAEPIGKITPTVDASSTQSQPVDAFGGSLNLATASGAQVAATIPRFAVAKTHDFSMTDIVALDGVPANGRMLAAVQMGPASVHFPEPVRIDFDVTGMRTPGTVLVGFRTDNDGENFRLIPLRDSNGVLGFAGTARHGTQVSLGVHGFSNIGLLEFIGEQTPGLIRQFLRQRGEFDFSTDLSEADEDALADE